MTAFMTPSVLAQPAQPRYKSSQRGVDTVVTVVVAAAACQPVGDWVVVQVMGLR